MIVIILKIDYLFIFLSESQMIQSLLLILLLNFHAQVGQLVFKGMKRLNRIQSLVFETAYNTNENLLICAPTGAGKTNIAMLTVLHEIRQHIQPGGIIKKDEFKV